MQNNSLPTQPNACTNEVEINMADVIQFFNDGKFWILAVAAASTLIGWVYALSISPVYEASVHVEMASVASTPVETPGALVEKLKLPLYYSTSNHKICKAEDKLPSPGQFLVSQLMAAVNKNAPTVTLKLSAGSADAAEQCLESIFLQIRKNQAILAKPILEIKKSHLSTLEYKLANSEKLLTLLPAGHTKLDFNDPKYAASALLLATAVSKESEIMGLRNQINEMQISLTSPQTRETTLITPIYAPNVKVAPNKSLIVLFSVLVGLVLGTLLFWARKTLSLQSSQSVKAREGLKKSISST